MTDNLSRSDWREPPDLEAEGEETIGATFSRLYADGREYAKAEVERQKLRAGILGVGVRDAAIFAFAAFMLVFAAVVTLLIGLVLSLSPALGPLGATAVVTGGALLVALALLLAARARINRMNKAVRR